MRTGSMRRDASGHRGRDGFAAALLSRPHLLLRLCAFAILLLTLGTILLMLRTPLASIDLQMGKNGTVELVGGVGPAVIPNDATISFRAPGTGERLTLNAGLLPGAAEPRGAASENSAYWAGRDRLAVMLEQGAVEITAGGQRLIATTRPRTLSDLTIGFWMSLVAGAVAALIGLWVWILRPRDWAPIMFALSGAALFVGCATTALNVSAGLGFPGRTDQLMLVLNYVSGAVCAGTLVALFARFPLPLVPPAWLWPVAVANVVAATLVVFDAVPGAIDVAIIVVLFDSIGIVALLLIQAWLSRRMPEHRAGLLPIAIGTIISIILFCGLSMIGQIDGGKPLVMPDITAPLLLMTYIGLGIAITRARLFSLGRWALSLLLSACAIILFLVIDAIVMSTVTQQRDLALLISAVLGATVYLPAREWMLRHAERLRDGQASDLLKLASEVALAPTPSAASQAWHEAARKMFDPLDACEAPFDGSDAAIHDGGRTLYLPAPVGRQALTLHHAGGGARIFSLADLDTAARFGQLVSSLCEARNSYVRGVAEERGRIARDLHDDVSARLLTSLHRSDTRAMHDDVRTAMADIRTIVTGLSGKVQSLEAVLAGLRHETQGRLEATGISLDWPVAPICGDAAPLAYPVYRHLSSIVRECVTNIIRHSSATSVDVLITESEEELRIALTDNGRGMSDGAVRGDGLANAARRAENMGGLFTIERIATGTRATIVVPRMPSL